MIQRDSYGYHANVIRRSGFTFRVMLDYVMGAQGRCTAGSRTPPLHFANCVVSKMDRAVRAVDEVPHVNVSAKE